MCSLLYLLLDRLVQTELCLNRQGVKDYFVTVKVKFNAKNIPESTGQSKPKPWERRMIPDEFCSIHFQTR